MIFVPLFLKNDSHILSHSIVPTVPATDSSRQSHSKKSLRISKETKRLTFRDITLLHLLSITISAIFLTYYMKNAYISQVDFLIQKL